MFMYVVTVRDIPVPGPEADTEAAGVLQALTSSPGNAGCWLGRVLGTRHGVGVSLWDTEPDQHQRVPGSGATVTSSTGYELVARMAGPAAGEAPQYAQITWFDGPRSAAVADATEFAGRERIAPITAGLPGLVQVLWGRAQDNAQVAVVLATSVESLEEGARRILSSELLPGEDPALLTGPDRVDVCSVLAHAETGAGVR
jgi:hypothetical protein